MNTEVGNYYDISSSLVSCLGALVVFVFFVLMYKWAKKQKGAAMAFGMFVQMFLPDPNVEQTIEMVVESKKEAKGEQQHDESSTGSTKTDNVNQSPKN